MGVEPLDQPTTIIPSAFGNDFDELVAFGTAKAEKDQILTDTCLIRIARRLVNSLSIISGKQLLLKIPDETSPDATSAWSEGADSIVVGIHLLRRLDTSCVNFALWLMDNFIIQNSSVAPSLPLPILKSYREFPAAALALFSGNMSTKATDITGRSHDPFAAMTAMINSMTTGGNITLDQMHASSGWIALPPSRYLDQMESSIDLDFLSSDPFSHLLLLYGRILSDSVALVLAHEAAHIILGHNLEPSPNPTRSREDEVAADSKALELLGDITDFDLRAAVLLFVFLANYDGTEPTHRLSHPFAADRLGVLIGGGKMIPSKMRKDLNAAFQTLHRPVPVLSRIASEQGITARASADLEYRLSLTLQLPVAENDNRTWTRWWELDIGVSLHDRVHPNRILRKGTVTVTVYAYVTTIGPGDKSRGGATIEVELPPSWWMDLDSSAILIESVSIAEVSEASSDVKPIFRCSSRLTDDEVESVARGLPLDTNHMLGIACARAPNLESESVALGLLLLERERIGSIHPHNLKWLGQTLLKRGRFDLAAQILDAEIQRLSFVPAGVRGTVAAAKFELFRRTLRTTPGASLGVTPEALSMYEEGFDLAFREMSLSSGQPEGKAAAALISQALEFGHLSQCVSALVSGIREFRLGADTREREVAFRHFQAAAASVRLAQSLSKTALVFPKQLSGESLFAAAMHGDKDFGPALSCFKEVLRDDPSFLPALTEMAKIYLEEQDFGSVRDALNKAERLSPAHTFVSYVRRESERRRMACMKPLLARIEEAYHAADFQIMESLAESAVRFDQFNFKANYYCAVAKYQVGRITSARESLEYALSLQGEVFDGVALLGQMLVELGADRDAYERLSLAIGCAIHLPTEEEVRQITYFPQAPYASLKGISFARAARGVALARLGKGERALIEAAKAEAGFPSGAVVLLDCAEIFRLAGRDDEAKNLTRRALHAEELQLSPRLVSQADSFLSGEAESVLPQGTRS